MPFHGEGHIVDDGIRILEDITERLHLCELCQFPFSHNTAILAAKVQGKYDIRNFQSEISGVIRKEHGRKDLHFRE